MPIRFESPQPIADDVYSRAGGGGGGAAAFEVALNAQARQQANMNQADAIRLRRDEFETSLNPTNRDVFQAQQSMNERGMAIQAQMAMRQMDFSHADNLRLQRLRQGQAGVMAMYDAGEIDENDRNILLGQVSERMEPLEARRQLTNQRQQQEEMRMIQARTANIDGLTALREQAAGQTGAAGLFQLPDPTDPSRMMPGWYRRNPINGTIDLVEGTSVGEGAGSSGGGSGSRGGRPSVDVSRLYGEVASETNIDGTPRHSTPEAIEQAVQARAESIQRINDRLSGANPDRVGGRLPFDRQPAPAAGEPMTLGSAPAHLNAAIEQAERSGQPQRAAALRQLAPAFQGNGSTGLLPPEAQETLRGLGYYRGEFTPEIDRYLGQFERPPQPPRFGMSPQEILAESMRAAQAPAAREVRQLLTAWSSESAMSPRSRERFNELRRRLGLQEWPPRPADMGNRLDVQPRQAPQMTPQQENREYASQSPWGVM